MSNPNVPFGFEPSRYLTGSALNFLVNKGVIAYNNGNTFGEGDVLILNSSGVIDKALTTSNPVLGVLSSVSYANPSNTIQPGVVRGWNAPTLPSTTVVTCQYWDDPNLVFRVRSNGLVTQTAIGLNATFTGNGAPNATTLISTAALDTTTIQTTNTLPFRIIGFAPDANNDPTSAYAVLEVVLNASVYKTTTGV